jgi:hypothetical protein
MYRIAGPTPSEAFNDKNFSDPTEYDLFPAIPV